MVIGALVFALGVIGTPPTIVSAEWVEFCKNTTDWVLIDREIPTIKRCTHNAN